jgi:hypothetical protein
VDDPDVREDVKLKRKPPSPRRSNRHAQPHVVLDTSTLFGREICDTSAETAFLMR